MNDILFVKLLVAFDHVPHEHECFGLAKPAVLLVDVEIMLEIAIFAIFQKEIKIVSAPEIVV
jgi:hypothetical protein